MEYRSVSGLAAHPEPFRVEVRPDRERVMLMPHGELDIDTVGRLAAEIDELTSRGFDALARRVIELAGIRHPLRFEAAP